jgi:drug/metabolite transporter (DMT)-like permease
LFIELSGRMTQSPLVTAVLTLFTLVAFAANSVLCRLALGEGSIDAASFSTIRLLSGAVALWLIVLFLRKRSISVRKGSWISAWMLFLYAVTFSYAYISLSTGTGALILFGAVQATMLLAGLLSGERPHLMQWGGLVLALGGLLYLVFPGLTAPSPLGSVLMIASGIAWGVYSIRGKRGADPLVVTGENFVGAVPLAILVSVAAYSSLHLSVEGAVLAVISGALTSGVGYVVWYTALRGLTATRASVVQLAVPVLAAAGGVLFLSEEISVRLIVATVAILGGIGLTVLGRERTDQAREPGSTPS